MHESQVSVSTRQASALLGVHESSIKRWCNSEEMAYWLTPGGHRRIPIVSLVSFSQAQGMELSLVSFGAEAGCVYAGLEQVRQENTFDALIALVYEWVEKGEVVQTVQLVKYLVTEGCRLDRILDRIVGPVMQRIGAGYLGGELSIGDEHRMTQAMRDTLVSLCTSTSLGKQIGRKPNAVALVGCTRGEVHELGALMVRLLLENEGWQVVYLGLNVPTEEFASQQIKHDATLVCVSMMPPMGRTEAFTLINLLDRMCDPKQPYRLVLGGSTLGGIDKKEANASLTEVQLFGRMEPFMTWLRALP